MAEMDQDARQHGASTLQEISASHKDLLRNLIDQQFWLSKGKELGITGDTELVKHLDDIRKQYHLDTMEDLEKAAQEQGVSFEDFKANIRNGIITQEVMRQEVGQEIRFTPGEAERYYEEHKQDYSQPESVKPERDSYLAPGRRRQRSGQAGGSQGQGRRHRGAAPCGRRFRPACQVVQRRTYGGPGRRSGAVPEGALPKLLEDKAFPLKTGEFTEPILTRQGYIILKVVQHVPGGPRPFKEVEPQVEDALYMSRMEPAIRAYLTKMREEAFIDIKPGYIDTGASPNETKPVYSAYTPPAPKKKAKVERVRFRETTHTFRQKSPQAQSRAAAPAVAKVDAVKTRKHGKTSGQPSRSRARKKKFAMARPRARLCQRSRMARLKMQALFLRRLLLRTEPVNPLEPVAPTTKTRFSAHAREPKQAKPRAAARCADSRRAGCRRSRRSRNAVRSVGSGRRYSFKEEEKGHHRKRKNAPGQPQERSLTPRRRRHRNSRLRLRNRELPRLHLRIREHRPRRLSHSS